ncbi:MAG: Hsp20/alpha crystallin family protein [Planctomycetes bacterium]|nr:Hsp20/alpha crystallin family protein [Planctomycetota bacterium]
MKLIRRHPGVDQKDIQVQGLGDELVVSGERKWEGERKDKTFHRIESRYGSLRRAIEFPEGARCDPAAKIAVEAK